MAKQIESKYLTNNNADDFGELIQPDIVSNLHSKVVFGVILLWVFLIIIGYCLIHKPILREEALTVCRSRGNLGIGLANAVLVGGKNHIYL